MLPNNGQPNRCAVLDTDHIMALMERKPDGAKMRKAMRHVGKVPVPDFVITELGNVRKISQHEAISAVAAILKNQVRIVRCDSDVADCAAQIESGNLAAHFPDTLMLAIAKFCAYRMASYDGGVISTARTEGIGMIGVCGLA